jgi:hypothetical protein
MSSASRRQRKLREKLEKENGRHPSPPPKFTVPPPRAHCASQVRIGPEPAAAATATATGPGEFDPATLFESGTGPRFNSLKDSLRSKLLFPIEMKVAIVELTRAFGKQHKPTTKLEWWLVGEMARTTIQIDICCDQMLINDMLVIEKAGSAWVEQCQERAQRLGARLTKSPHVVKGALERTKYGALYLIDKLELLKDVIDSAGCIDEEQRQSFFDLVGIDHVYRNGSPRIPAGTDAAALSALVVKEIERHRSNLAESLIKSDRQEQQAAMVGISRFVDAETRRLKSNQSRARRRLTWAWDALKWLRMGVAPADIIDNESGKPLDPKDHESPTPADAEPSPSDPADAESGEVWMPTFLQGASEETRQDFTIFTEAYLRRRARAAKSKAAPAADQSAPAAEPEPPSA